jgi:hypothetical protein
MPKFAIAFVAPDQDHPLRHRIVESSDEESAIKDFFTKEAMDSYSNDDQGFFYFKEDFSDKSTKSGSILKLES